MSLGVTAAAFFDLDKTVIAKSSTLAFGRPFYRGGLVNRRAVLKSSFAQFVYLLQGADEDSMDRMRDYLKALCAGWPVEQVNAIVAETLHDLIEPMVYAEAVALFDEHHAAGRDVVIVSSSGEEVVGPIGEMLGVDHVIATRMVVEDGRYTGEIDFYAYGEGKAVAVRALAARARLRPVAVLGLQRLLHRPAAARAGRQPGRRQPRQGPAPARGRAGLAAARVPAAGPAARACAARARPARAAVGVRGGGRRGRRRGASPGGPAGPRRPPEPARRVTRSRTGLDGPAPARTLGARTTASGRTQLPPTAVRAQDPSTHVRPATRWHVERAHRTRDDGATARLVTRARRPATAPHRQVGRRSAVRRGSAQARGVSPTSASQTARPSSAPSPTARAQCSQPVHEPRRPARDVRPGRLGVLVLELGVADLGRADTALGSSPRSTSTRRAAARATSPSATPNARSASSSPCTTRGDDDRRAPPSASSTRDSPSSRADTSSGSGAGPSPSGSS